MKPFTRLTSRLIPLPLRNVDTDQIIPARYLKVTDKAGLADGLFHDWRYDADGSPTPDFVLNKPEFKDAKVLLVGDNFGCGSSREHAPWALMGWGIRAIISTSFADIFRNNSVKNGLLPVVVDEDFHKILIENAKDAYLLLVTIDLNLQVIEMPDGNTRMFQIDSFTRSFLLNGVDQLGYIRSFEDEIEDYEGAHPVFI